MLTKLKIYFHLLWFFKFNIFKVQIWINTPNPLLGNVSPRWFLLIGREEKLLKFIKNKISENFR